MFAKCQQKQSVGPALITYYASLASYVSWIFGTALFSVPEYISWSRGSGDGRGRRHYLFGLSVRPYVRTVRPIL